MGGGCIIVWKNRPIQQARQISNYLTDEYSAEVADKFLDKIALKIDRISDYPETGHPTRFKAVRRVRIDKYHSLYYRIQKKKIIILYLWDGRQDPKKNLYGR
jgi:plasmid stabilization system protein ParE